MGFAPRHAYANLRVVKRDMFEELTAPTRPGSEHNGQTILLHMLYANGSDTDDVVTSLTDIV